MASNSPGQLLEWDMSFFGVRVGRIEATRLTAIGMRVALDWASRNDIECLYFLCVADDDESVRAAETHGFHLVDVRLTSLWQRPRTMQRLPQGEESIVRRYRDEDKAAIEDIAAVAYSDTRFFYDRRFGAERAAALYREWAAKSCDGAADAVLVAADERDVRGFITCQLQPSHHGQIGLAGVHSGARGSGVGQALVEAALTFFMDKGADSVQVVTQGRNIAAQRLYQKYGFRSHSLHLWYHKWFGVNEE